MMRSQSLVLYDSWGVYGRREAVRWEEQSVSSFSEVNWVKFAQGAAQRPTLVGAGNSRLWASFSMLTIFFFFLNLALDYKSTKLLALLITADRCVFHLAVFIYPEGKQP